VPIKEIGGNLPIVRHVPILRIHFATNPMSQSQPTTNGATKIDPPKRSDAAETDQQGRRFDEAHRAQADPTDAGSSPEDHTREELAAIEALGAGAPTGEQLRRQSLQLASLLSERQKQLDRRETELNARTAKLEKELRNSQIWLRERQFELGQSESEQRERARELDSRAQEIERANETFDRQMAAREAELREREAELKRREEETVSREAELDRRRGEFQMSQSVRQAQWLSRQRELAAEGQRLENRRQQTRSMFASMSRQLERRREAIEQRWDALETQSQQSALAGNAEIQQALEQIAGRQQALDAQAALLDEQQLELEQLWEALHQQREQLADDAEARQQEFADQRRKWTAQRNEVEAQLKRRREALDRRAGSLQALHDAVVQRQRDSLEMRLSVEQIWSQLAGKAPPAELTQRLGQIRTRLAQHRRDELAESDRRKAELLETAADLGRRQAQLREQSNELRQWVAQRHEHLEEQAARLVAREQELDQQEQAFRRDREQWAAERVGLQQHLRRLQGELRRSSAELGMA